MWMNKHAGLKYKFDWEDEYFAFSFGSSQLKEYENYLENQFVIHEKRSVKDEIITMTKKHGIEYKS